MNIKSLLITLFLSLFVVAGNATFRPSAEYRTESWNMTVNETIFDNTVWWINKGTGPAIQFPMAVYVNGVNQGTTYLLEFGHRNGDQWPGIAAIYNTGFLRLTPPGLPFGTSFILGPGYWGSDGIYVHNIQISRIDIDTTGAMPYGPLQLTIHAHDYSASRWPDYRLEITYTATLADPDANSTQMTVTQNFSVVNAFSLSADRQALHEGFKWAQFSSMYINGFENDSDSALYVDSSEVIHLSKFSSVGCGNYIFNTPTTLSSTSPWVEALQSDDIGWQGNTPNTIININSAGLVGQVVPQGYITCSSDPNDDNVAMWINHNAAPLSFNIGDTGTIAYTLISQDNPRQPPLIFSDVPVEYWSWKFIESLYHAGVTSGCSTSPAMYCPTNTVTRDQMAVFLLRGKHGSGYTPPPASGVFQDVPTNYWAASWIEQLAAEGITSGCNASPKQYCPTMPVTRDQMAVFLLRARHGSGYVPPEATGEFQDVPTDYWAADWIEQLAAEGITSGCSVSPKLYCPATPVPRDQMAVFLVRAFSLP